jgi:hypothetical protein
LIYLRNDGAKGYKTKVLQDLIHQEGISHEVTERYCPQSNGLAEELSLTIMDKLHCMLIDAILNTKLHCMLRNQGPRERRSTADLSHARMLQLQELGLAATLINRSEQI